MDLLNSVAQHPLTGAEHLPWLEQGLLSSKRALLGDLQDQCYSRHNRG